MTQLVRRTPTVTDAIEWTGSIASLLVVQEFMMPHSPLYHFRSAEEAKGSHQPHRNELVIVIHDRENERRYTNLGAQFKQVEVRVGDWIYKDREAFGVIRKEDYGAEWAPADDQAVLPLDLMPVNAGDSGEMED